MPVRLAVRACAHVRNRTARLHIEDSSNGKRNVLLGFDYGQAASCGSENEARWIAALFQVDRRLHGFGMRRHCITRGPGHRSNGQCLCAPQRANVGIDSALASLKYSLPSLRSPRRYWPYSSSQSGIARDPQLLARDVPLAVRNLFRATNL